ncbi:MAG: hypothetical protein OXE57_11210 [Alphaproteobacteria bacterium]|nr:hypothetical protein [Alphaproteobacteria bacterium]
MNEEDAVVNLVALHGGRLVGKTRLQKGGYLLHRCGANLDSEFVYHHYGPYSFELAMGVKDARAHERIAEEDRVGFHGIAYAIFSTEEVPVPMGGLSVERAKELSTRMDKEPNVVLELAATIAFLRDDENYGSAAIKETKARKPLKATPNYLRRARELLNDLGLGSQAVPARR